MTEKAEKMSKRGYFHLVIAGGFATIGLHAVAIGSYKLAAFDFGLAALNAFLAMRRFRQARPPRTF